MKIRGIIFDKDGTLFDIQRSWSEWANVFVTKFSKKHDLEITKLADAIQFEASPYMSNLQIKKLLSLLKSNGYIYKDLENNKRNFYCAKKYIVFDKYLNLNYINKNNWIPRIKNKNILFHILISYLKNLKYYLKKFIS